MNRYSVEDIMNSSFFHNQKIGGGGGGGGVKFKKYEDLLRVNWYNKLLV